MSLDLELTQLSHDEGAKSTHILAFRKNFQTCYDCLDTHNKQVSVSQCLSCSFYKEKTLNKSEDSKLAKKLVTFFYRYHPITTLVPNKVRDLTLIRNIMEYLDEDKIFTVIKYLHRNRVADINQIAYVYNQALAEEHYRGSQYEQLLDDFYRDRDLVSPNWYKEVSLLDQQVELVGLERVVKTLEYMRDKRYRDLRLFTYMRNECDQDRSMVSNTDYLDESDMLHE